MLGVRNGTVGYTPFERYGRRAPREERAFGIVIRAQPFARACRAHNSDQYRATRHYADGRVALFGRRNAVPSVADQAKERGTNGCVCGTIGPNRNSRHR